MCNAQCDGSLKRNEDFAFCVGGTADLMVDAKTGTPGASLHSNQSDLQLLL